MPEPALHLTRLSAAHTEAILAVWEASVRATHDFLPEADITLLRALIPNYLPALTVTGAWDGQGRLQGFSGVGEGRLEMLFVTPECRGQGVGGLLLRQAVREHGVHSLDVNEQNPQALGFYLAMGFEVVGRSPLDGEGQPYPLLHLRLPP